MAASELSQTRPVRVRGRSPGQPNPERRYSLLTKTKLECPRGNPADSPAIRQSAAAVEVALASLESADDAASPKRRADSRAPTEPRTGRSASCSDTIERRNDSSAAFLPSHDSWLGVAVAQPEVGARVVIGTSTGHDFVVTSPVAKIVTRDDGLLVKTTSNNCYFVAQSGDAYLVRRVG